MLELPGSFYPFGQDDHVQLVAQRHYGFQQGVTPFLIMPWTNKGLVNLDDSRV